MKKIVLILFIGNCAFGQSIKKYPYESSVKNPFGLVNPNAPVQTADFAHMIGQSDCISVNRNPDGSWQDSVKMLWTFKYIMNGMAVQDGTLKEDGKHSGSIRQYNADSAQWYVSYYSSSFAPNVLPVWYGNMKDGKIVLKMKQKSPNGFDGYSRLTFYDISDDSFKWIGEWIDVNETIVYPFWKISCYKKLDDSL